MPLTVRKFTAQVRDDTTGDMIPAGLLSSDALGAINTAKTDAVAAITAQQTVSEAAIELKGTTTLASIPNDYTALQGEVDDLENTFNSVMLYASAVDFSIASSKKGYVNPTTGSWIQNNNAKTWFIPITSESKEVTVTANAEKATTIYFLKNDTVANQVAPNYCTGTDQDNIIAAGTTETFIIPSDCNYIGVREATSSSTGFTPSSMNLMNDAIAALDDRIDEIENVKNRYVSVLPDDYIQLEYLESNRTSYVSAGIKADQDTRFVCDFQLTDSSLSTNNYIFGGRRTTQLSAFTFCRYSNGKFMMNYYDSWYDIASADFERHTVDINKNSFYLDGVLRNTATAGNTFDSYRNVGLFGMRAGGDNEYQLAACRIFSVQWYDNDDLKHYYIPCVQVSTGLSGFYDTITGVFISEAVGDSWDPLTRSPAYGIGGSYSKVQSLEEKVDNNIESLVVPEYVEEESDRVSAMVRNDQTGTSLTFVACSDLHYPEEVGTSNKDANLPVAQRGIREMSLAIQKIAEQTHIDFYACFGDVIYQWQSHAANYDNGVKEMIAVTKLLNRAFGNNPQVRMVGNHDPNCENSDNKEFSAYQLNSYVGIYNDMLVRDPNAPYAAYGYHDFERQKVRLIVLDTSAYAPTDNLTNGATLYKFGYDQAYFLCQALIDLSDKSDGDEWQAVICSHVRIDYDNGADTDLIGKYSSIIDAYLSGGTWSIGSSRSYIFGGHNRAKLCAYINGHSHVYSWRNINLVHYDSSTREGVIDYSLSLANLGVPNAIPGRDGVSTDGVTYEKTECSARSTAFQVITIDFENKIIYARHYGAGIDIIMHYDPSSEASYSTNLTSPTWASVDTNIATVSSGIVTPAPQASGYVMIYAKSETDNCVECWNYHVSA